MTMNELGEGLYQAEMAKLEAETVEARAILKVYFNHLGFAPFIMTEIDK